MRRASNRPDWGDWLRRWDLQQESFNPNREERFGAMLDVLQARMGRRVRALDLGCGPGSLSLRILRRFPTARVTAVDYDPVVRQIGEGALGTFGGRLDWVDAKLGRSGWTDALPRSRYDAAVSTTALHWLTPTALARLYRDLARLLRPGGVFLNGDYLPWGSRHPVLDDLASRVLKVRSPHRGGRNEWGAWSRWWREARRVPALRAAFEEHDRRSASHPHRRDLTLDLHVRLLRVAGFRWTAVVWQDFENRVLLAVR